MVDIAKIIYHVSTLDCGIALSVYRLSRVGLSAPAAVKKTPARRYIFANRLSLDNDIINIVCGGQL